MRSATDLAYACNNSTIVLVIRELGPNLLLNDIYS